MAQDDQERKTWWTFAGSRASLELPVRLATHRQEVAAIDNASIAVDSSMILENIFEVCGRVPPDE